MRKLIFLLFAALMLLMGCAAEESEVSDALVIVSSDDAATNEITKITEEYTKETGVEIEIIKVNDNTCAEKVNSMISADDAPDMVYCSQWKEIYYKSLEKYGESKIVELSSYFDLTYANEIFFANSYIYNEDYEQQGLYTIPLYNSVMAMIVNLDILNAVYGEYVVPSDAMTWSEFEVVLSDTQAYCDNSESCDYALTLNDKSNSLKTLMNQMGYTMWSEDGQSSNVNTDGFKAGLSKVLDLFYNGYIPKGTWIDREDPKKFFLTGTVGFHFMMSGEMLLYTQNIDSFEYTIMPLPTAQNSSTYIYTKHLFVIDTENKEKSIDFVEWVITPQNYVIFCDYSYSLPAFDNVDVSAEPFYDVYMDQVNSQDIKYLLDGQNRYDVDVLNIDYWNNLVDVLVDVLEGKITLGEACAFFDENVVGPEKV